MNLQEELISFLRAAPRDPGKPKRDGEPRKVRKRDEAIDERNLLLILDHFMFGTQDVFKPTLDELGGRYGIQTRERVRQVIDGGYAKVVEGAQLPRAKEAAAILESKDLWLESEFIEIMNDGGFTDSAGSAVGLVAYLHSQSLATTHEIYLPDLRPVTRGLYLEYDERVIVQSSLLEGLKRDLAAAQGIPGSSGLVELETIRLDEPEADLEALAILLRANTRTWRKEEAGRFWYSFEDRVNVLVNNAAKLFAVAEVFPIDAIGEVLANSLARRACKYPYPDADLIREWVGQSTHFTVSGGLVTSNNPPADLTSIEQEVIAVMRGRGSLPSDGISRELMSRGYSQPSVQQNVFKSAIVAVDKSGGRTKYRYTLVSDVERKGSPRGSRYDGFRARLRGLTDTDREAVVLGRTEQSILTEWVFAGADHADCALCGRSFSTRALVTAHKKKRAHCTEYERRDPYIVFPLCLFGCDFLYEKGIISVQNGVIVAGAGWGGDTERRVVEDLVGRVLDERWTAGPASYFDNLPRRTPTQAT